MVETKRWNVNNEQNQYWKAIEEAAALLKSGETVAFPTETVYGLGADATNPEAVAKIFAAKGRPQDNPLIAHVATINQLKRLVDNIPTYVEELINIFSPGPITYVLSTNGTCAENVTAGLSTIGVRIPDHPVAQDLLETCDIPVAAPSANISGKPSPTTADHVWDDLYGKIAGLLDGGPTGVGLESTVVDCTQDIPIILRPGGITKEQLEEVVGTVMIDPALANKKEKPKAPGMKYRHYSPDVPMLLVEGSAKMIQNVTDQERELGKKVGILASKQTAELLKADEILSLGENIHEIATHLYDGLRKFKQGDVDIIVCEAFSEEGIGQAVMNRLKKAASESIRETY
ncbi:L-threonylcarbamoyladenylate synthase [Oceanobacillus halophilus]|uniref:Threonylcarbamoyl-AMP synthase n=1 Tax=Oceanobacillus halophilus TaxID=930130 RepID=A0A495A4C0_9BACI|nr:L-threonylcarbamoyladenylate synthase [Oceanobacillus halophilus]RKQ34386.1 threonylcarbamoyl-AMP synthase [Oceanobacillus halophilus]